MKHSLVRVMVIFGTRPEALKLATLIEELREHTDTFETYVCVTAQHRQMLDQVLDLFSIKPDFDLNLMERGQSLAGFASRALTALDEQFRQQRPDVVVVQGDTTTTFTAALAAFYNGAKVAHVEAGLRSFNKAAPFPEEINRRLTTHLADFHFAPTQKAFDNLIHEGIEEGRIFLTGNTIVDTLQQVVSRLDSGLLLPSLRERFSELPPLFMLVTVHRRENHGRNLGEVCKAVRELHQLLPDAHFFFPVHLNPQVQAPVSEVLSGLERVHLLPPLDYPSFVWLMQRSSLVVSDSGGVQEECCALQKQVLVTREVTERYEAVESGFATLVGCERDRIVSAAYEGLMKPKKPDASVQNPFGDGHAAERIVAALASRVREFVQSNRPRSEPAALNAT